MVAGRYPERAIQEGAVAWLAENRGYVECFSDVAALGSRVDTVGTLGGRLLLAEVKVAVPASMVDHAHDRPGSLESKFAGALRTLYGRGADELSQRANDAWNRESPPLLGVIARSYSPEGLDALAGLFARRAPEWLFDYAVWRWDGGTLTELVAGTITAPPPDRYADVQPPLLIGRALRAPKPGLTQLGELAEQYGCSEHFQAFVRMAAERGMRLTANQASMTAARKEAGKWVTVLGMYLEPSVDGAVNVALSDELAGPVHDTLPGSAAPAKGYLNLNRWIRGEGELAEMFELAASARLAVGPEN